ncbi:M56 family metallopeptidase [Streptomyces sp. UC4497]
MSPSLMVIAALLAQAVLLGGPAARLLVRVRFVVRHPRAALRLWHACALGVLASLVTALVLTAHDLWEHAMVWLFHADLPMIHVAYGGAWQAEGIAEAGLLALLLGAVGLSAITLHRALRLRRERERHRLTADTLALRTDHQRDTDTRLRVLSDATPTAFCIPGLRGRARIVVTTAARDLLSTAELAATVEHERAHLSLRHHRAILAADVCTTALGRLGLLRPYAEEARRLAELAADDEAAQGHGRRTVASALLEMAAAPTATGKPPGLLAMNGAAHITERVRRLIAPAPARAHGLFYRAAALTLVAAAIAAPVALALTPAVLLADTAHLGAAGR